MKQINYILLLLALASCKDSQPLDQFELVFYNYDYAMAFSKKYVLTEKDLSVVFRGEIEGEKDSTIYFTKLDPSKDLKRLSKIDFINLENEYRNDCVDDGYQMSLVFTKDSIRKSIHLSNYHQEDIGNAIQLINNLVPEDHKIYYDKEELIESMKNCESWE